MVKRANTKSLVGTDYFDDDASASRLPSPTLAFNVQHWQAMLPRVLRRRCCPVLLHTAAAAAAAATGDASMPARGWLRHGLAQPGSASRRRRRPRAWLPAGRSARRTARTGRRPGWTVGWTAAGRPAGRVWRTCSARRRTASGRTAQRMLIFIYIYMKNQISGYMKI